MSWLLWLSLALLLLSGALALIYELFAIFTRRVQTITDIVRGWETQSPLNKLCVSGLGTSAILGLVLLLAHFLGGF